MLALPSQSLAACVWVSVVFWAAFGLSEFSSPTAFSSLESRQADTTKCPTSYTAQNGLNFTTYCDQDIPNDVAIKSFSQNSIFDCMDKCSRFQNITGGSCVGVTWSEERKVCWLRNSTIPSSGLIKPKARYHSALAVKDEINGYNTSCPNEDSSINSLAGVEDVKYTTHCGKYIEGDDECFSGYPCLQGQFIGFFHAKSLEQCVRICTDQHPLCKAVSWNPGLELGFANCRPRTSIPQIFGDPGTNMGIMHAASILQINQPDRSCPSNKTWVTPDTRNKFDIRCGQLSTGSNLTAVHTQNVTACMSACVSWGSQCVGAVFDSSLAWGYNNCYLQNTTNVVVDQASATYLARSEIQGISEPTKSGDARAGTGSSKAWVAGPIVGAFVFAAIVCFAVFLFRRRRAVTEARDAGSLEKDGNSIDQISSDRHYEAPSTMPPVELGAREVGELS